MSPVEVVVVIWGVIMIFAIALAVILIFRCSKNEGKLYSKIRNETNSCMNF